MNKRLRRYKRFLQYSFVCSLLTLLGVSYFYCYSRIPSNIKIRAGMEQTLEFGVPVTGEFTRINSMPEAVAVSEQPDSELQPEKISMELSQSVTLSAMSPDAYRLQLKLFGIIPLKQVEVEVIEDEQLIPAGIPIGIYVKTEGVLVIGVGEFENVDGLKLSPSRYLLKVGDYILKVNEEKVVSKNTFMKTVESSEGQELILTVQREDEIFQVKVAPAQNESGEYKLGIWIRDNAQGVGTLTFIDEEGGFGALGHGINDVDTDVLLELEKGTLYHTDIIAIRKGLSGMPGEMTGMIEYSENNILGEITENRQEGIFGNGNDKLLSQISGQALPIGLKQEIEIGPAQILCMVDNRAEYYDIQITKLHLDYDNVNRGIVMEITDDRLLDKTGGIVQGMSGSPILQNGRIVGAVTHVLVNDPTKGYGIFIENMLEH